MEIRRGDIILADLSPVVGSQQGGLRPVLIIQNDVGNKYSPTVIVAAITAQITKCKLPTHIELKKGKHGLTKNSVILLEDNHEERYAGFDPNSPESYIMFSLTQNAFQDNSLLLANNIENQFEKRVGRKSRGVKQAGFQVLWNTYMPSVLVEIGYLTNPKEESELAIEQTQDYIASGIYRAFKEYKNQMESIN